MAATVEECRLCAQHGIKSVKQPPAAGAHPICLRCDRQQLLRKKGG